VRRHALKRPAAFAPGAADTGLRSVETSDDAAVPAHGSVARPSRAVRTAGACVSDARPRIACLQRCAAEVSWWRRPDFGAAPEILADSCQPPGHQTGRLEPRTHALARGVGFRPAAASLPPPNDELGIVRARVADHQQGKRRMPGIFERDCSQSMARSCARHLLVGP